jgi:hypothetical protein
MSGTPTTPLCPSCHGEGRIQVGGMSVNPSSGIQGWDPQQDRDERCGDCGGTGAQPVHAEADPATREDDEPGSRT